MIPRWELEAGREARVEQYPHLIYAPRTPEARFTNLLASAKCFTRAGAFTPTSGASIYRRYAIVAPGDLSAGVEKLAAYQLTTPPQRAKPGG